MIATDIGISIAALLTLMIFSYLITEKQNVFFRFAQSTLLGGALGYIVVLVMAKNIDALVISRVSEGNLIYVIPLVLGILVYFRFIPRYAYIARIPVAIIVSVGIGIGARASLETNIVHQILATASLVVPGIDVFSSVNNIIYVFSLIAAITYFFFTIQQKTAKTLEPLTTLGRYVLMIYFGATFGSTVMTRLTVLLGRIGFLLFNWLGFQ